MSDPDIGRLPTLCGYDRVSAIRTALLARVEKHVWARRSPALSIVWADILNSTKHVETLKGGEFSWLMNELYQAVRKY